jgi:hypothetical protein
MISNEKLEMREANKKSIATRESRTPNKKKSKPKSYPNNKEKRGEVEGKKKMKN